ncbi:hypothetical protein PILCRDRAFT_810767 [Piloderma croceum F 1598]|uniref:Uncharacterized protein n=1 Tax=Piloderma croceum (strain F 1598) TaxID=765440 RepID=A0A0C3GLP4_PILCF|nr:hypothetical protein PILCRDRAFT_810767 [Piloderma croceum F 1598]
MPSMPCPHNTHHGRDLISRRRPDFTSTTACSTVRSWTLTPHIIHKAHFRSRRRDRVTNRTTIPTR